MKWIVFNQIQNDMVIFVNSENPTEKRYKGIKEFEELLKTVTQTKFGILKEYLEKFKIVFFNVETEEYEVKDITDQTGFASFNDLCEVNIEKEEVKESRQDKIINKSKEYMENIYQRRRDEQLNIFNRR